MGPIIYHGMKKLANLKEKQIPMHFDFTNARYFRLRHHQCNRVNQLNPFGSHTINSRRYRGDKKFREISKLNFNSIWILKVCQIFASQLSSSNIFWITIVPSILPDFIRIYYFFNISICVQKANSISSLIFILCQIEHLKG
ncbi:hypothetical protein BpHYR1_029952 [Brachionus plicatilis]|uniref:Uncharacterized protein n=1 Tax=Brachionus plicatilis TaxID=10195 RepID=A0A3M7QCU1_BRAPC|nr:hypothetical protein BpHYR1_029952 [Brachionus plicatilis]